MPRPTSPRSGIRPSTADTAARCQPVARQQEEKPLDDHDYRCAGRGRTDPGRAPTAASAGLSAAGARLGRCAGRGSRAAASARVRVVPKQAVLPARRRVHPGGVPHPARWRGVLARRQQHGPIRRHDHRPGRCRRYRLRHPVQSHRSTGTAGLLSIATGPGRHTAARPDRGLGIGVRPERLPDRPGQQKPSPAGVEPVVHPGHGRTRCISHDPDRVPDLPGCAGRNGHRFGGRGPQRRRRTPSSNPADDAAHAAPGHPQLRAAHLRAVVGGAGTSAIPRRTVQHQLHRELPVPVVEQQRRP